MAYRKICPIMSASPEVRPCVKERCQFWVQYDVTPPKGDCLFNDIRSSLYRISMK